MIKLGNNLKEMWDLHFDHTCPEDILMYISYIYFNDKCEAQRPMDLKKMRDIFLEDLKGEQLSLVPFEDYLGGGVFFCDKVEDLKEISTSKTTDPHQSNNWLSLYETADSFDICEWMFPDNAMVCVVMMWNDAGGASYFIPKAVADQCPNVEASINQTHIAWKGNDVNQENKPNDGQSK